MFFVKILLFFTISFLYHLTFAEGAWAWGPAIHTVIACKILSEANQILPAIGAILQEYPLEYLYGSLSADFFIFKGQKKKEGHSHNWETGFRFMRETKGDREAAYAYGFFSHLAADVVAHNYFVPNLVQQASIWKRMGHLYWEARADSFVGPEYLRMARQVLSMENLGCDDLLKFAVGKRGKALKARKHLFTQSVKLSDFLAGSQPMVLVERGSRYTISREYQIFMIQISYRLVKNLLTHPSSAPCLSYDPIGSKNLRLAGRKAILSKLFNIPRPVHRFNVDRELLNV